MRGSYSTSRGSSRRLRRCRRLFADSRCGSLCLTRFDAGSVQDPVDVDHDVESRTEDLVVTIWRRVLYQLVERAGMPREGEHAVRIKLKHARRKKETPARWILP
jgi:hypothetical protein